MRSNRSVLFAFLLIAVGVVLLLQEMDVIPDDVSVWPIVLIGAGVLMFVERVAGGGAWGSGFVFPLILVALGTGFLLKDTGVLDDDQGLAPLVVIAVGAALVLGALPARASAMAERGVPLEGATRARIEIEHGAGALRIGPHIGGSNLLEGRFAGGGDVRVRRDGERIEVGVKSNVWRFGFPWERPGSLDWWITLARNVPIALVLRTGAGRADVDLSDIRVEDLTVETGASRLFVALPSSGRPTVRIRGGATEIKVVVPSHMAARIQTRVALSDVWIDPHRFPRAGGEYRSPGFDEAADRAEIEIEAGAASVEVN